MARTERAERVHHVPELGGALPRLDGVERHARPGTHRLAKDLLCLVGQHDLLARFPVRDGGVPVALVQIDQVVDALGGHERHEHGLAVRVRLPVERLHAALAEDRFPDAPRGRTRTLEAGGIVEEACGLGATHADDLAPREAGAEHVGTVALALALDPGISLAQQRQRAVG